MKIIPEMLRKTLNGVVLFFFGSVSLLIVYGIATGFPITLGGWIYRAKNLKVLFLAALVSWILHLILGPEGAQNGVLKFKRRLESAVQDQRHDRPDSAVERQRGRGEGPGRGHSGFRRGRRRHHLRGERAEGRVAPADVIYYRSTFVRNVI